MLNPGPGPRIDLSHDLIIGIAVAVVSASIVMVRRWSALAREATRRRASEAELDVVFRAMRDVVLVLSRDGEYLRIPSAHSDLLARPSSELIGKTVRDVLPPADADAIVAIIRDSLANGRVVTEYPVHLRGDPVWFSAVVTPLDADSVVWVARDVTTERATRHALHESEAQFRLLFDRNPQPMFVLHAGDLRFIDVNEAAIQTYGYTREQFLTMTAADIRRIDDSAEPGSSSEAGWLASGSRVLRHRRSTGEVIEVEVVADDITYMAEPAHLVTANDVTAQRAISHELERSLSLQRATLEATADGILVVDQTGRVTTWNGKFAEMWGILPGVASAEEVERIFADRLAGVKGADATVARAAAAEAAHRATFDVLEFDDGRVIERYSQPQRVGADTVGRVWSFRDVTQRERAIAQRKMLGDRFEGAFGEAPIGMVIMSPDGRLAQVNNAMCELLGRTQEELVGQTSAFIMHPDDHEAACHELEKLRAGQHRTVRTERRYRHSSGRDVWALVHSTRLSSRADNSGLIISQVLDITERRELERHLLQAQKLEAIGSLASGIAHEINTPTQYVGDNVRFMGDGIDAIGAAIRQARSLASAARHVAELSAAVDAFEHTMSDIDADYLLAELPVAALHSRDGCDRIADIVQAMKAFSHPGGTQKQLVDLNATVRNTLTVCRSEWKYVAMVEMNLDANLPLVPCLPGELQQVVLNLIINAAHAITTARGDSGELGRIVVSTRTDGDWADIRIEDDGCGIPENIRGKVFDPFFTTKKVGMGTGQGLSIGHATIVRKHHGTLTFETVEGRGTTFIIRLPLSTPLEVGEAA